MHSPKLCHRIVSVFHEDPLVQFLRPGNPDGGVDGFIAREIQIVHELIQEQTSKALCGTAVSRKKGALHRFGQVHQRKDGEIEIGEVSPQHRRFIGRELLWNVDRHEGRYYENCRAL